MPWILLSLAIFASIHNAICGDFKIKFAEGVKGLGWTILFYFVWKVFVPTLLFTLSAITWIWGRNCP